MTSEESTMEIVEPDVEEVDELQQAFDLLENSSSSDAAAFQAILQSERSDELALKIKEKCVYK